MRITVYEATVYPPETIHPELNILTLIDMTKDDLEVRCKSVFVRIHPKPVPLARFNPA